MKEEQTESELEGRSISGKVGSTDGEERCFSMEEEIDDGEMVWS